LGFFAKLPRRNEAVWQYQEKAFMPQTLTKHLQALPAGQIVRIAGDTNVKVKAPYAEDSRQIQKGGVFVARKGLSVDGHEYIQKAIAAGAVAIVGERAIDIDIPYVQVRNASQATGYLAAAYHGFPSRKLIVIGVSGTNGKTTTTHMIHGILKHATGNKTGFISTIGAEFGESSADTGLHVTTPTAPEIQDYLAQMVDAGLTHAVLEMTSHGLEQGRLVGVDIDIAVITNVTHEHLDFHGSYEAYRAAKGIMFEMLSKTARKGKSPKVSILNRDDSSYEHYLKIPADKIISYGLSEGSDVKPDKVDYAPDGIHLHFGRRKISLNLVGEFNAYNALAAMATAEALNIEYPYIKRGLEQIASVSGRMQRIDEGQNFTAIVDFAHTPDALEKAISAARSMMQSDKRLIVIFGSAGLRDIEKRYLMAEVAAKQADFTILTAEDPRTENLDAILQMMADGCTASGGEEGKTFIRVPDRGAAIFRACQLANEGDMVMACGKGHEQSMAFGTIEYPWDDRDAMRAALRGEPLVTLPTAHKGS
jgi:UDP-N-acetylmuramoyl-L-alanyl-D-glutamate--2,6-diaminopimelate ligase